MCVCVCVCVCVRVCVCERETERERERAEREREEKKHLCKEGLKYGKTQDPFSSKAFCQQVALNFDPRGKYKKKFRLG
jgi:hypothetical protein